MLKLIRCIKPFLPSQSDHQVHNWRKVQKLMRPSANIAAICWYLIRLFSDGSGLRITDYCAQSYLRIGSYSMSDCTNSKSTAGTVLIPNAHQTLLKLLSWWNHLEFGSGKCVWASFLLWAPNLPSRCLDLDSSNQRQVCGGYDFSQR